jgi:phospholipid transport system substrate-binding protein
MRSLERSLIRLLIQSLVLFAIGFAPAFAQDESPAAVIESAVTLFAEKMDGRHDELAADPAALYALIDEILLPRFDRKFAGRLVMAKHWPVADETQRSRFIEAFYQALLRRYADGLLEFDQERVSVLPFRGDDSKPKAKVKSTVELNDGTKVAVDYQLVKRDSGWLLYDVVIEGVSYIRNFRSELDSEIRSSSLDAVIERLEGEAGI